MEKQERSYAKKKHKTEPIGIRFNILQIGIALSKSRKDTKQELVDWLIDRYVNGENPIAERQQQQQIAATPYQNTPQYAAQMQQPPTQPLDKVSQFRELIQYSDTRKELEKYVAQAKKELDWRQFPTIQSFAEEVKEKKGFIYND